MVAKRTIEWPKEVVEAQRVFRDGCILRADGALDKDGEWKYIRDNWDIVVNAFNALIAMVEKQYEEH